MHSRPSRPPGPSHPSADRLSIQSVLPVQLPSVRPPFVRPPSVFHPLAVGPVRPCTRARTHHERWTVGCGMKSDNFQYYSSQRVYRSVWRYAPRSMLTISYLLISLSFLSPYFFFFYFYFFFILFYFSLFSSFFLFFCFFFYFPFSILDRFSFFFFIFFHH